MIKKLKSNSAETLIESLVAMLIAVLSMAFLTTSILTAANVNGATKNADRQYSINLQAAEGQKEGAYLGDITLEISFFKNGSTQITEKQTIEAKAYGRGEFLSYDYNEAGE